MNVPISTTIERMEMMMRRWTSQFPIWLHRPCREPYIPTKPPKWWGLSRLRRVISTKSVLCWCLLSYSLELNLFAVPGAEGKFSFLHLFVAPFSDIFFCVFLSHRSFCFRCLSKAARLEIQGFSEKYYPTVWRFFRKPKARPFISKARCHTFAPAR